MRVPARFARAVARPPLGPASLALERHRAFIRALPCVACGRPAPSECAAVGAGTDPGRGLQPTGRFLVPLCGPPTIWEDCCHSRLHYLGRTRFWSELGIDPFGLAARLWRGSGGTEARRRPLMRPPPAGPP